MNPLHQLTRRPVKAAFGVLLLALAGAILCLSGGQYWAAAQTRAAVEENYTTVAVVTGGMQQLVASGNIVMEHRPRPGHNGPCQRIQSVAEPAE